MQLIPGTAKQGPPFSSRRCSRAWFNYAEQHFSVIAVISERENLHMTRSHYPKSLRGKNKTD